MEEIADVLEHTVSLEEGFNNQQEPLIKLEKKEADIYQQVIHLGMKEQDQIVKLADEALNSVAKREELMEAETKSIKQSKKEFKKIATLKTQLEDTKLSKIIKELDDIMQERYQVHDVLYKEYKDALEHDKKLYQMFKNKDVQLNELEQQVKVINSNYKNIKATNLTFNQLTEQFNIKKSTFYKKAGITDK